MLLELRKTAKNLVRLPIACSVGTISDGKLGEGLGTRLLKNNYQCVDILVSLTQSHVHSCVPFSIYSQGSDKATL